MWTENNDRLTKSFKFDDFSEAFAFMTRVAFIAEKMDHHPDWSNSYNKITINLTTHSANSKITYKDHDLAEAIDKITPATN